PCKSNMFFTIEKTNPVLQLGKLFEIYKVFMPEYSMKKALATKPRLFMTLRTINQQESEPPDFLFIII
ncbi:hypothetical protein, partial [Bacillus anthracis]